MAIAKVTSKGQVTIPKSVRDRLGLRAGDHLDFRLDGNGILRVEPVAPGGGLPPLAGFLDGRIKKRSRPATIEEMDRAVQTAVAEHVMRSLLPDADADAEGDDCD